MTLIFDEVCTLFGKNFLLDPADHQGNEKLWSQYLTTLWQADKITLQQCEDWDRLPLSRTENI
jgi:hypothetical protein